VIPESSTLCSYSGDPSSTLRDQVRFWCQDTDENFWILTDWEYDYLIEFTAENTNTDPVWIASVACGVIASKFTREVTVSADGVSVDVGSLQRKYMDLAVALRDQYDEQHGDLSLPTADLPTNAYTNDPTIPPLLFGIGMSDNFYAGLQDYGWRRLTASNRYSAPETDF
jgi:hypothetical protein